VPVKYQIIPRVDYAYASIHRSQASLRHSQDHA